MNPDILAFTDTETTSLTPKAGGRVIEFSCIVTSPWPEMRVMAEFHTKLKPSEEDLHRASPKALEVNGYDKNRHLWEGAPATDSKEVWQKIYDMLKGVPLCCQNYPFDSGFIEAEMVRAGVITPGKTPWDRRYVDTYSFCHVLANELGVRNPKTGRVTWGLAEVYKAMGGPELPQHSAKPDVLRMIHIYKHFRERYAQAVPTKKVAALKMDDQASVQLAGCLVAAEGNFHDEKRDAAVGVYGWSPAYEETRALRLAAEEMAEAMGASLGKVIARYRRT